VNEGTTTTREGLAHELDEACDALGLDELRVVALVAKRLVLGRKVYGPLDVAGDRRDWRHEASEEALDCAVYLACESIRGAEGSR
jgi:hypothetical protein